jgi:outer membrane protein assembly factor BamA
MEFSEVLPFSSKRLLRMLGFEKGFLQKHIPFVESKVNKIQTNLSQYLQSEGYLKAHVDSVSFEEERGNQQIFVDLDINLILGPQALIKKLRTSLPQDLETSFFERSFVRSLQGKVFKGTHLRNFRLFAEDYLLNEGIVFNQIEPSIEILSEDPFWVQLGLEIDLDKPVLVGAVLLETDIVGKDDRLIQVSGLKADERLSMKSIDRARRLLMNSGLFENVSIVPKLRTEFNQDTYDNHYADIVIHAKAKTNRLLTLKPSYGSFGGYGFDSRYLFHRLTEGGFYASIQGSFSEDKSYRRIETPDVLGRKLVFFLSEPFFPVSHFVTPFTWESKLDFEVRSSDWGKYSRSKESLKLFWAPYFWNSYWKYWIGFSAESILQQSEEKPLFNLFEETDPIMNGMFFGVSLDSRDFMAWPKRGMFLSLESEANLSFLNASVSFNRMFFESDFFFTLPFWSLTNSLSFGFGKIFLHDDDLLPSHMKRFSLLGKGLIRGFPTFTLRPGPLLIFRLTGFDQSNLICLGTRVRSLSTTHLVYFKHELRYRFPIYSRNLIFGTVLFLDSGLAFFSENESKKFQKISETSNGLSLSSGCKIDQVDFVGDINVKNSWDLIRYYHQKAYLSTGFGFRFIMTNVVKVELDWGFPLFEPTQVDENTSFSSYYTTFRKNYSSSIPWLSDNLGYRLPGAIHLSISAVF